MVAEELRSLLRQSPFVPFRVYMNSGHAYEVSSPEWMMVTEATTALGIPGKSGDGERLMLLSNINIRHTEPMSISPAAAST